MSDREKLKNDVRGMRDRLGWSQAELAQRAGLSRAGVSAIEMGRLVPSTAAALALAAALECTVESLFRLGRFEPADQKGAWVGELPSTHCRYWRAEVGGRQRLYPVEVSALGLQAHDGIYRDGSCHDHEGNDPLRTLVLASCDPAVGLLALELERRATVRLIVLPRSSGVALDLLARGLVHAAGVHLAGSDEAEGNAPAVLARIESEHREDYQLLRAADWEEGIALGPGLRVRSVRAARTARLRWVDREAGSGAHQCLDMVLGRSRDKPTRGRLPEVRDHRGVAAAIGSRWADAGICLRLTSEEASLSFLCVRKEAYEICFADSLAHDPRLQALVQVVRSARYRRMLGELPGYDTAHAGEIRRVCAQ